MLKKNEKKIGILILCILSGICFLSCSRNDQVPDDPPNILVLLIDALRADRLHDYGYFRNTNPNLAKFGKNGIRFTKAYSHSSHTKISVASIFTGLIPPAHKVRRAAMPSKENVKEILSDVLSSSFMTLSEVLSNGGYHTVAFVTNPHLRAFLGFDQGFNDYKYVPYSEFRAKDINSEVMSWIKSCPGRPFFMYIHYMDVHAPYDPPNEYRHLYTEEKNLNPIQTDGPWNAKISEEEIKYTEALYDAQINYWDDCFQVLVNNIRENGELENTLIIILADHGEEFYDHGGFGQGYTLYEEELLVPLYMVFDGFIPPNQTRTDSVQLIDIFPTICHFARATTNNAFFQGNNLFHSKNKESHLDRVIYAETYRGKTPRSVQTEKYKLIYNSALENFEFYDIFKDPKEKHNIYEQNHPLATELKVTLFELMSFGEKGPASESKKLDPKTIKELRSLGYIK